MQNIVSDLDYPPGNGRYYGCRPPAPALSKPMSDSDRRGDITYDSCKARDPLDGADAVKRGPFLLLKIDFGNRKRKITNKQKGEP